MSKSKELCGSCSKGSRPIRKSFNECNICACGAPFFSQIVVKNTLPASRRYALEIPMELIVDHGHRFDKADKTVIFEADSGSEVYRVKIGGNNFVGFWFEWKEFAQSQNIGIGQIIVITLVRNARFLAQIYKPGNPSPIVTNPQNRIGDEHACLKKVAPKVEDDDDCIKECVAQDWLAAKASRSNVLPSKVKVEEVFLESSAAQASQALGKHVRISAPGEQKSGVLPRIGADSEIIKNHDYSLHVTLKVEDDDDDDDDDDCIEECVAQDWLAAKASRSNVLPSKVKVEEVFLESSAAQASEALGKHVRISAPGEQKSWVLPRIGADSEIINNHDYSLHVTLKVEDDNDDDDDCIEGCVAQDWLAAKASRSNIFPSKVRVEGVFLEFPAAQASEALGKHAGINAPGEQKSEILPRVETDSEIIANQDYPLHVTAPTPTPTPPSPPPSQEASSSKHSPFSGQQSSVPPKRTNEELESPDKTTNKKRPSGLVNMHLPSLPLSAIISRPIKLPLSALASKAMRSLGWEECCRKDWNMSLKTLVLELIENNRSGSKFRVPVEEWSPELFATTFGFPNEGAKNLPARSPGTCEVVKKFFRTKKFNSKQGWLIEDCNDPDLKLALKVFAQLYSPDTRVYATASIVATIQQVLKKGKRFNWANIFASRIKKEAEKVHTRSDFKTHIGPFLTQLCLAEGKLSPEEAEECTRCK